MTYRPITATVITQNEVAKIARCLSSLTWADEILVIDAMSTDGTAELCLNPEAPWAEKLKFVRRAWTGFRDQRNEALRIAAHDWVLVVDSDEAASPELALKIRSLLGSEKGPPLMAYKVRRVEYFLGRVITAGIWSPSWQDRFFNKKGVSYINEVHEYPVFAAAPGRIDEPIHHDPTFNIDRFLSKMNFYTTIEARDRVAQGRRTNVFRIFTAFFAMFLKNFFYYKAYRDGIHGFIISILEGLSRTVRHVKIWQLTREKTFIGTNQRDRPSGKRTSEPPEEIARLERNAIAPVPETL